MGQGNPKQQVTHQIKQQDGRTGKKEPQGAVQQADLSLKIKRMSGIIPYI